MPRWIREIYRLMLAPNGEIRDIDDFVAIKVGKKWYFIKKYAVFVYSEHRKKAISLKRFIKEKVDIKCRSG